MFDNTQHVLILAFWLHAYTFSRRCLIVCTYDCSPHLGVCWSCPSILHRETSNHCIGPNCTDSKPLCYKEACGAFAVWYYRMCCSLRFSVVCRLTQSLYFHVECNIFHAVKICLFTFISGSFRERHRALRTCADNGRIGQGNRMLLYTYSCSRSLSNNGIW